MTCTSYCRSWFTRSFSTHWKGSQNATWLCFLSTLTASWSHLSSLLHDQFQHSVGSSVTLQSQFFLFILRVSYPLISFPDQSQHVQFAKITPFFENTCNFSNNLLAQLYLNVLLWFLMNVYLYHFSIKKVSVMWYFLKWKKFQLIYKKQTDGQNIMIVTA